MECHQHKLSRGEICVANFRPPCDIYDQQSFISIWSIGGRLGHIQGSANRPTMDRFENFSTFFTQNPNSNGVRFIKKFPTHVFRVTFCGPFWKIGGLPIGPQWTDLKIFQLIVSQNQNKRGSVLWKKLPTHVFRALHCRSFWTYWGVCQSAQNCPILKFLNIFLHKI